MQALLRKLVTTAYFDVAILVTIGINSLVLAIQTASTLNPSVHEYLVLIDKICIGIFTLEALLKLIVYRVNYFKSGWNIFDFIIVVIALLPFAHYVSVFRALRIVRALRLIAHVPALKRVVEALLLAIPGLMATAGLLLLVFFVFGVMGVELFGPQFPQWFGHLGRSMFSLFQVMTLESWSMGIARPVMAQFPYAWLYFVPFILISAFILLNFLIGIVVDAIAHVKSQEASPTKTETLILERLAAIEQQLKHKNLLEGEE